MKKLYFLFLFAFSLTFSETLAQNIPNAGFESWTQHFFYAEPVNFSTTNFQGYFSGTGPNVTKTTDAYAGNFAARLEAVAVDTNVLPGFVSIGTPGPGGFAGGFPFNELPDTLAGFVKYDITLGDSAFLLIIFTSGGSPIAASAHQFYGVQSDYAEFKVPLFSLLPVQPDTFQFFLATTSNFDSTQAGSVLFVDELHFIGATATFPNGGFEDWTDVASEEPDGGWITSNFFSNPLDPTVTKTGDAHSGNFAIRLENKPSLGGTPTSFAILGQLGGEDPEGGFPISNTPKKISGYYKYFPVGTDSSIFITQFSKWNQATQQSDSIANIKVSLPPANTYTSFEIPLNIVWSAQPDTMLLGFAPSYLDNDTSTVTLGSVLQVDDLEIEFVSGIIVRLDRYPAFVNAFPNPAGDFLHLSFDLSIQTPVVVVVHDGNGRTWKTYDAGLRSGAVDIALPVSELNTGTYFYSI
ncbi:MAG: hypothetical protein HY842_14470, partial [Bacteroidetes bacterium]|nr:hypothetical protein [Bacteroidota bacterium]